MAALSPTPLIFYSTSVPATICGYAGISFRPSWDLKSGENPEVALQVAITSSYAQWVFAAFRFHSGELPLPRNEPTIIASNSYASLSQPPSLYLVASIDESHSVVTRVESHQVLAGPPYPLELWPQISALLLEIRREFPSLPIQITSVGPLIGSGKAGDVYECPLLNHSTVLKIERAHRGKPLDSLVHSLDLLKMAFQIPKGKNVISVQGLGYDRSSHSFGLIFAKIPGMTLGAWLKDPNYRLHLRQVLLDIAVGLQHLDLHGWPHEDNSNLGNFIIRLEPSPRCLVIDHLRSFKEGNPNISHLSLNSRRSFGDLLQHLSPELLHLAEDCVTPQSLEWAEILTHLRTIKPS